MTAISRSLLKDYMRRFVGYGNLAGRYWFIGMEEGGGGSEAEIERRLNTWDHRGRMLTEDLRDFHADIRENRWFGSNPRLQPTWSRLIRLMFSAQGNFGSARDREAVRTYQASQLGTLHGETALLELLPLPSPGTDRWLYASISDLPELRSRDEYSKLLAPTRVQLLQTLLDRERPDTVVCYGIGHMEHWQNLFQTDIYEARCNGKTAWFGERNGVQYCITQHPTATGVSNNYWIEVGNHLAKRQAS